MQEQHKHEHNHNHEHAHHAKKGLHKDWRAWTALVLMLAAMLAYVMSDDESLQVGGGKPQAPMPAAAGL